MFSVYITVSITIETMMKFESYYSVSKHPFVEDLFRTAMEISKEIKKTNGFKVNVEFEREPVENEFYVLQLGYCMAHLLTTIQQMEHTVMYMSNFSPTDLMKEAGINRSTHLLWSVENYVIRSQTSYDRLLVLIDRLFNIQNKPNRISHESIVTNTHIQRTKIPNALKPVKKAIKKYYHDRNTIIHESSYADDELRHIEGLAILSSNPDYELQKDEMLKEELKYHVRRYVKKRKTEYTRINKNLCIALGDLFSAIQPIYKIKYAELCAK